MNGLGNEFIVFDLFAEPKIPVSAELARAICDRRSGVGADQVLWLGPPIAEGADARMEIRNADGSVAEMCGNGIRAIGVLLSGMKPGQTCFRVETLAGMKTVELEPGARWVRVGMGVPILKESERILLPGAEEITFIAVNLGNPHAVVFVPNLEGFPVAVLGPQIERHAHFSNRTNVEFVEVVGASSLRMKVWERGVGITSACGTGACAAAVAARASRRTTGLETQVVLDGGTLRVMWAGPGHPIFMEGPAVEEFRGVFQASEA